MPEKNQNCSNCYFFYQTSERDGQEIGYCRANPPHPYYAKEIVNGEKFEKPQISRFPIVLGNMWCGAFDYKDGEPNG